MTHEGPHRVTHNVYDTNYQTASVAANTEAASKKRFLQYRADWQAMYLAGQHGFVSGAYYGLIFGLAVGIYKRQMSPIYRYSIGWGAIYGSALASSNYFRTDL